MREFASLMPWTAMLLIGSVSFGVASDFGGVEVKPVTKDTFIRAEVDARILRLIEAGGVNRGLVYSAPNGQCRL